MWIANIHLSHRDFSEYLTEWLQSFFQRTVYRICKHIYLSHISYHWFLTSGISPVLKLHYCCLSVLGPSSPKIL